MGKALTPIGAQEMLLVVPSLSPSPPDLLLSSLKKQVCQVLKKKNTSTFKCPFPSSIYHPNLILFSFFRVKCIFKKWCRLRLDFLIHPSTEFAFHSHLKNASSHRNVPPGGFPRPRPHYPLWYLVKDIPLPLKFCLWGSLLVHWPDSSCPRNSTCSLLRSSEPSAPGKAARAIPSAGNARPNCQSQLKDHVSMEPPLAAATSNVCSFSEFSCVSRFSLYLITCHFAASHCFTWQKRNMFWNQTLNFNFLFLWAVWLWARPTS